MRKPEVKVEQVPLASLKAYNGNAKKHDNANIDAIAASIEEFGFRNPILAWHNEDGIAEIVAGHGRAAAAKKLRLEEVPVVFVDDLTDAQRRMLTHADNQTTLMTGWDEGQLAEELDALMGSFDVSKFGFGDFGIESLRADDATDDDFDCTPDESETISSPGDIWQLGEHLIMCGDATSKECARRLFGGAKADMMLTDPPYGIAYSGKTDDKMTIANDALDDAGMRELLDGFFSVAKENVAEGGACYVWHPIVSTGAFQESMRMSGFNMSQVLIWVKNTFSLNRNDYKPQFEPCLYGWNPGAPHSFYGGFNQGTVIDKLSGTVIDKLSGTVIDKLSKAEMSQMLHELRDSIESDVLREKKPNANRLHPTMKPVPLFAKLIENSSKRGQTVYDPFLGSGTTLIACEQLGRRCVGFELDPKYFDVIIKRWEEFSGKKAVKSNG